MKSDGKIILRAETEDRNPTDGNKVKASSVLMQMISCGSVSTRDCDNPGFWVISHYKSRNNATVEDGVVLREKRKIKKTVTEDKEYFSGSLIEIKKEKFPTIKRSNSYAGNR
ncbi:hypothetical protein L1987_64040 [Smallanthus sonchifolius]|uniref:Uncharacterized protein n=1 Tax=Smallanthus sonchifolius TaxID=185202 RepID=A0ACB9CEY9_9ASTR|nr:hypothetical protein L1987_64040 [Smallanthus sonchifolius]